MKMRRMRKRHHVCRMAFWQKNKDIIASLRVWVINVKSAFKRFVQFRMTDTK